MLWVVRYFIRKERGFIRDPKTGRAPNRLEGMRYTELADDLVSELGRVGQKARKVRQNETLLMLYFDLRQY